MAIYIRSKIQVRSDFLMRTVKLYKCPTIVEHVSICFTMSFTDYY